MIPYRGYRFRSVVNQVSFSLDDEGEGKSVEVAGWLDLWISATEQEYQELQAGIVDSVPIDAQLSLYGSEVPGADTGKLDLQAWNSGTIRQAGDEWSFEVEFPDARLLHESLVAERGYISWGSDVFVTRPEIFVGRIEGIIRQRSEPGGYPALELSETRMKLTRRDSPGPGRSPVTWVELRINGATMEVVLDPAKHDGTKFPCPSGGATPKILAIGLVFFENTQAVRAIAADQVAAAQEVWNPACIRIDDQQANPLILPAITTASEGGKGDVKAISKAAGSAKLSPNDKVIVIPVFIVRNKLTKHGGGVCFNPGTALAKVVISTDVTALEKGKPVTNRWLLSHELGHVLSGWHPHEVPDPSLWDLGVQHVPLWEGEEETVLEPSGSASNPVLSFNSMRNCWAAWLSPNPALTNA